VAATAVLALTAAACAGSAGTGKPPPSSVQVDKGGTLVLPLGIEPTCADWLAPCGQFLGGFLAMARPTSPRALDFINGQWQPTPLLTGMPTLEVGPPERLTYRINPKAVWSDGVPITSSDFRYAWDQNANGPNISNRTGYDQIDLVDDSDPKTAVVTFRTPFAGWRTLFPTLLPAHLLQGKDRTAELKDGYSWSGGPWIMDHWTRGQEVKLVPNPRYWDKQPNLDAVVWKLIPDPAAALEAYKSGQIALTTGVPPEEALADLQALPDTKVDVDVAFGTTHLNFNTTRPPLDSVPVRQSLAYALDRDLMAAQGDFLKPDVKAIQSFMTPADGKWYVDSFSRYRPDPVKIDQLMRGDGWSKGADGIWAKIGQRAEFELLITANSKVAAAVGQILQSQWKAAGFSVNLNVQLSNTIADSQAKGTFQASLSSFAFSNYVDDPGRCLFLCSQAIPSAANGNSGMNVMRISNPALDEAWARVNSELDDARRLDAVKRANDLTADLVPMLPLYPGVALLVYNTSRLAGPVTNNVPSPFYNLNEWWCRAGRC